MIIAGLLAGGIGSRMNNPIPKQFIKICNVPILIRTINKFINLVDKVVIATNKDYFNETINLLNEYKLDKNKIEVIIGGTDRFSSLTNIVKKAYEIDNESIVISDDIVRPFVSERIIKDNIDKINEFDAVITIIPVIDAIAQVRNGIEVNVPNKSEMFLDQSPQTFRSKQFLDLLDDDVYIEIGKLYLKNNLKVGTVEGDRYNFKITNDIDLSISEYLVKKGKVK